jgi:hypothetical protein
MTTEEKKDPAASAFNPEETPKAAKLRRLTDLIETLVEEKFTGYIKVNFSQGGIGRIEKLEEVLK